MNIQFKIYRYLLAPFAKFTLEILGPILPKKLNEIIKLKKSALNFNFTKRPFWIHAASGEIEYAKPLIRELKKKFPEIPILVTYSSTSAITLIENIKEIEHSCIIPWDTESAMKNFISLVNPLQFLIARTDIWPEMMWQISSAKIPSILFSATLTSDSPRLKGFTRGLSSFSFVKLSQIFCVSELDKNNFLNLDSKIQIAVTGDSRFEQVLYRLQNPKGLKENLKPIAQDNVLVAGSTWPEDDDVLIDLFAKNKTWKCIWAPHEIKNIPGLTAHLTKAKISFCLYSQADSWNHEQVLIIDQIGILADLYSWGNVAFVGGSFRAKVHSVMEPLASGKSVIVGPHFSNNREAIEFSKIAFQIKNDKSESKTPLSLVTRALNMKQFEQQLNERFSLDHSARQDLVQMILREVRSRIGSVEKIMNWIEINMK